MPLSEAELQTGLAFLQARIHAGADVNECMRFPHGAGPLCECTPLGFAVLALDQDLLEALLAVGAYPNKHVGLPARFEFTPLQLAVAFGFAAGVRVLLQHGADPNAPLQPKRSGHIAPAASAGVPSAQQLLLPDCFARSKAGDAPLHVAIDCAAGPGASPENVGGSRMEVVEALIGHEVTDLERRNARGRTPLYKACKRHIEVFVALLATHPGVDVNAGGALFAAIKVESPQLVRALLQAGARVQDEYRPNPLLNAMLLYGRRGSSGLGVRSRENIVRMLVQAGAPVIPDMLTFAEEQGWHDVLTALRERLLLNRAARGAGVGEGWSEVTAAMQDLVSTMTRLDWAQQLRLANYTPQDFDASGGSGQSYTIDAGPGSRVGGHSSNTGGDGAPSLLAAGAAAAPPGASTAARTSSPPTAAPSPRRWPQSRAASSSSVVTWRWRPAVYRGLGAAPQNASAIIRVAVAPFVLYALYTAVRGLSWLPCLAGSDCGAVGTAMQDGGPAGAHALRNQCDALQPQPQPAFCVSGVVAAAAESLVSVVNDAAATVEPGDGGGDPGKATAGRLLSLLLRILWNGYLGFCVAIAAWLIAMVGARLCIDGAVVQVRLYLPPSSRLAAYLSDRISNHRSNGGGGSISQSESGWEAVFLLLALLCRLFKGASFGELLLIVAAGTALKALAGLVYDYVRQYGRTSPLRDAVQVKQLIADLPSAPPLPPPPPQLPAVGGGADSPDAAQSGPSGDGGRTAGVPPARVPDAGSGGLEGMCCVCMSGRAVIGFIHPDVVHCCLCSECEAELRGRRALDTCLICKRSAAAVTKVIVT